MAAFTITDEKKSFFDEFGFLVFRQLFSSDEVAKIQREAQATFDEIYAGEREGGTHGRWVALLGPSSPLPCPCSTPPSVGVAAGVLEPACTGIHPSPLSRPKPVKRKPARGDWQGLKI